MRALAVVAVMVYHANNAWLPGGFLGVEVFFVISGYLITLLLIGEHERTGRIRLGRFYQRRARRLLPALFVMLALLTVYTALFRREELGRLRGDVLAGLAYVSNWFQIWVGQGYTAEGQFAPLRHLWSLAVEEQFYLIWPLVMIGLIRIGGGKLPSYSRWLMLAALVISVAIGLLYDPSRAVDADDVAERLLGRRRPRLRQDRRAVPLDDHPVHRPPRRRRPGDAVASRRRDARAVAHEGPGARRARPRRPRRRCWCWRGSCTSSPSAVPTPGCSAVASSPSTSPRW